MENEIKQHTKLIKKFLNKGGIYIGVCLGAYVAGNSADLPGFGLLPDGISITREIRDPKSEIRDTDDSVIHVDWLQPKFTKENHKTKLFFQDGAAILGLGNDNNDHKIIAKYSKTNHVSAAVFELERGQGILGLIGTHPEAEVKNTCWCKFRHEARLGVRLAGHHGP